MSSGVRLSVVLRSLIGLLLLGATSGDAFGQYIFLDANGDSLNSPDDMLSSADEPTSVLVFLVTDHDLDGSPASCQQGSDSLTVNSYEFILEATDGTVEFTSYTNLRPTMNVSFGLASNATQFYVGFGGAAALPAGKYCLGSLTITGRSGHPSVGFAPYSSLGATFGTSFGSRCMGADGDNTLKLGTDWHDAGGLSPSPTGFLTIAGNTSEGTSGAEAAAADSGCAQTNVACDFDQRYSILAPGPGCQGPAQVLSIQHIQYILRNQLGNPVPNCPITIQLRSDLAASKNTGGHCHNDTDKPTGTVPASCNTGGDGLGCGIDVTWPEVGGRYYLFFTSSSGGACGNVQSIYTVCIKKEVGTFLAGLLPLQDGPGYVLTGETSRHPDHHYGTTKFLDALKAIAKDFADSSQGATPLGYNDISLRWGGVFDVSTGSEWHPPHCGHRMGDNCDMRTHTIAANGDTIPVYTGDQMRLLARICDRRHVYPYVHAKGGPVFPHWHLQPKRGWSF
jgi:hypothetical protein